MLKHEEIKMKGAFSSKMSMFVPFVLLVATGCLPMQDRLAVAPGASRLVVAAERGDIEEVRSLLAQGVEAHEKDWALMRAASRGPRGRTEIVELLLERGADVNAQAPIVYPGVGVLPLPPIGGETALMGAALGGYRNSQGPAGSRGEGKHEKC